ncbi:MAG TPA: type II secretion system F family protein [Candidatus Thermoplasmatota archaeon]|nr:type II secretion system F family protein [Candidatus Thermoplasmatota archaeon]
MTGLGALDRLAYTWLGKRLQSSKALGKLEESLRKAQMPVRPEAYLAKCVLVAVATAVLSLLLAVLGLLAAMTVLDLPAAAWVLVAFVPPMAGYTAYVATQATPASNAKKRAKNINQRLAYATNYIAAMASAGVIPAEIFKSLAKQAIYGEAAKEAAMIYKDLEVHGKDIVTSLRRAIDRTPSVKFQELLQGAITTITSGGDLTAYFRQKAQRYQWENRVEQKSFIDTMGLMAETYVTSAVAGPLFLIVMVAIIVLMGSGTMSQLQLVIFLLLPVINLGFMLGLRAMIPEV